MPIQGGLARYGWGDRRRNEVGCGPTGREPAVALAGPARLCHKGARGCFVSASMADRTGVRTGSVV